MKYTQKRTQEGRDIVAIRERLSSLTPEDFQWFLTLGADEIVLSFFLRDDSRGMVELRSQTWEGLMHRVSSIDWFKQRGEVFEDIEKQEAFASREVLPWEGDENE